MEEAKIRFQKGWDRYALMWEQLNGWRAFLFFVAHYTLLFLVLSWFLFSDFRQGGRTFIWTSDGMPQHFTSMVRLSQIIRNGIQSLLAGDGWTIPLYDFHIGTTKNSLEVELLQWIAVLWPWDRIDILYDILVLLRYYLVGVSFAVLGYYFKQKTFPILIGAVSYVFCGFSIYAGVRHPFFLGPMILLPLLLIGTEKVLKKEEPFFLMGLVFLSVVSSLYFSYMLAIIIILYALVRFPAIYSKNSRGREFLSMVGRLIVAGGTGIALGGVVVIPTLIQMLDTGRIGRDVSVYADLAKYSLLYYGKFLSNFVLAEIREIGAWTCLGFSILTFPAVLLLFIRWNKEERSLRLLFIVSTVMLLSPAVAHVMSGFNTTSNRWCFAYALCASAILMFQIPHFEKMSQVTFCFLGIGMLFYALICYVVLGSKLYRSSVIFLLFIAMLLVWICWYLQRYGYRLMFPSCLLITCMTICYGASLEYAPENGNYVSEFTKKEEPYQIYADSQYGAFSRSKVSKLEQPFYRVTGDSISTSSMTSAFYYGIHGLTSFSSYQYPSFMQWIREMEMPRSGISLRIYGLQNRTSMLTLAGVKYYVLRESNGKIEPYGFQEIERIQGAKNQIDIIMENQYALPIGYTYDSYLPYATYERLSALERQNAQIQAVILGEAPASSDIMMAEVQPEAHRIPANVVNMEGLSWEKGVLRVKQEKATLTLEFSGLPQTETYLRVVNLDLSNGNSTRRWHLAVDTESTASRSFFAADAYLYTNGMKTRLIDLGYTEDGFTTCTLTFPQKGTFELEDLEIWCQSMNHYGERIEALREEALENVETNWRGLTGTISVSRDKMLCIAIPYDSGWSAYVDGEKVKLYQANTAFMAVELSPGNHEIELKYWTPGLTVGILLTCAGVAGLIVLVILERKKSGVFKK